MVNLVRYQLDRIVLPTWKDPPFFIGKSTISMAIYTIDEAPYFSNLLVVSHIETVSDTQLETVNPLELGHHFHSNIHGQSVRYPATNEKFLAGERR